MRNQTNSYIVWGLWRWKSWKSAQLEVQKPNLKSKNPTWSPKTQDAFGANFHGSANSTAGEEHHQDLDTEVITGQHMQWLLWHWQHHLGNHSNIFRWCTELVWVKVTTTTPCQRRLWGNTKIRSWWRSFVRSEVLKSLKFGWSTSDNSLEGRRSRAARDTCLVRQRGSTREGTHGDLDDDDDDDDDDLYIIGAVCHEKWSLCPTEPSRTFRNLLEPSRTF